MARIEVMLDVPSDDCGSCDYFCCDSEECLVFSEDIFYNEETDCYERCWACKDAQKKCSGWN